MTSTVLVAARAHFQKSIQKRPQRSGWIIGGQERTEPFLSELGGMRKKIHLYMFEPFKDFVLETKVNPEKLTNTTKKFHPIGRT